MEYTKEDISKALGVIFNLPLEDLERVITGLNSSYSARSMEEIQGTIPKQRPNFKFPSYISVTHAEWALTEFVKEVFNSNFDTDYYLSPENAATHDNSVIVQNNFNKIDEKKGQTIRVVVQAPQSIASKSYLADINQNGTEFIKPDQLKVKKSALLEMPISISVISGNYNEVNILACFLQVMLIENMDILRDMFNIYEITFPSVTSGRPIKNKGALYLASVQMTIRRYISWSNVMRLKNIQRFILRMNAIALNDNSGPITQVLAQFEDPISPEILKVISDLQKRFKIT